MPLSIKRIAKKIITKYIDPKSCFVFLFGSRAVGKNRPQSDYDVGIYTGKKIPLIIIAKIKNELEEYPIPVDIDFVDFAKVSRSFKKIALQEIELWNTPQTNLKLI